MNTFLLDERDREKGEEKGRDKTKIGIFFGFTHIHIYNTCTYDSHMYQPNILCSSASAYVCLNLCQWYRQSNNSPVSCYQYHDHINDDVAYK